MLLEEGVVDRRRARERGRRAALGLPHAEQPDDVGEVDMQLRFALAAIGARERRRLLPAVPDIGDQRGAPVLAHAGAELQRQAPVDQADLVDREVAQREAVEQHEAAAVPHVVPDARDQRA